MKTQTGVIALALSRADILQQLSAEAFLSQSHADAEPWQMPFRCQDLERMKLIARTQAASFSLQLLDLGSSLSLQMEVFGSVPLLADLDAEKKVSETLPIYPPGHVPTCLPAQLPTCKSAHLPTTPTHPTTTRPDPIPTAARSSRAVLRLTRGSLLRFCNGLASVQRALSGLHGSISNGVDSSWTWTLGPVGQPRGSHSYSPTWGL